MEIFNTKEEIEDYITLNYTRLQEARANGDSPQLQAAFERRTNEGLLEYGDLVRFNAIHSHLFAANLELGQE